jgi:hypothetical protein
MKTAVRNIATDLVDKRLWPIAAALLIATIAIPVLLARGGAEPAVPAAAQGGAGASSSAKGDPVRLDTSAPPVHDRGRVVRNPFAGPTPAAAATTNVTATTSGATVSASAAAGATPATSTPSAAGSTPVSTSAAGSSSTAGSSSAAPATTSPSVGAPTTKSGSATTTTSPTKTTTSKTGTSATYSVGVRFGRTDGKRTTLRDVARLTALPNAKAPVVSLLGVLRDGRTAVLKVAANATASGSGTCKPSASRCTTVEMTAGDAEYLSVTREGGSAPVAWYYLKLLHVDRHETTSTAVASAAYARRSAAGMAVVRQDAAAVRAYRYLPGAGVLVRAAHRTNSAAKAADAGVAPLLPADEQRGLPVWRSVPRSAGR